MLKSCCALLFLLFPCAAAAQYPGDEYYPYAEREERRELLTTDSTLFYRAVQSPSDLYGLRTGFNLPQVALRRRGLDYTLERTSLMGVAVSYRYLAALRLLGCFAFGTPGHPAPLVRNLSNVPSVERWYRPYMKALMEFDPGRAFFPDANLTLRVAYGAVEGYRYADGVYHKPLTTIEGVIAKDDPAIYDYNVPQRLRELCAAQDYGRWAAEIDGRTTVPVCFLATNHTTGGNSGSPVLNGRGELVGINFDRTWLSTMSDIEFDPDVCRNIAVDIRYVLLVIDRIGGAGHLIDEMEFAD